MKKLMMVGFGFLAVLLVFAACANPLADADGKVAGLLNFTATAGIEKVELSWEEPAVNFSKIKLSITAEGKDAVNLELDKGVVEYTVDELEAGLEYTFSASLIATNGVASSAISVTATPEAVPAPVTPPPVEPGNEVGISLFWVEPITFPTIHYFNVTVATGEVAISDTDWPGISATISGDVKSIELSTALTLDFILNNGTPGDGGSSTTQSNTIAINTPGVFEVVNNFTRSNFAFSGVTVKWPASIDGKSYNRVWYWGVTGAGDADATYTWDTRPELTAVDGWFTYTLPDATAISNFRPDDGSGAEFMFPNITTGGTWTFNSDKTTNRYSAIKQESE